MCDVGLHDKRNLKYHLYIHSIPNLRVPKISVCERDTAQFVHDLIRFSFWDKQSPALWSNLIVHLSRTIQCDKTMLPIMLNLLISQPQIYYFLENTQTTPSKPYSA